MRVMESKSEKFQRLAEARTTKAITALRSLGKLSNRSHYDYDQEQIKLIFSTLKKELDDSRSQFERHERSAKKVTFKL